MDLSKVLLFGAGLLIGGGVTFIHEKISQIDISEIGKASNDSGNNSTIENSSGQNDDRFWSTSDKERVSEFLQNTEYRQNGSEVGRILETPSTSEAQEDLVESDDSIDISDEDTELPENLVYYDESSDKELSENRLSKVDAVDFVKAAVDGKEVRSFIYNPSSREIFWNFTYRQLTENEIETYIGKGMMKELVDDCNKSYWVNPRYLYDRVDDTYAKIEIGTVM